MAFQRLTLLDAEISHKQVSCAVFSLPGTLPTHTAWTLLSRYYSSFHGTPVQAALAKAFQRHSLHLFCLILTLCLSLLLNAFVCKKSHKGKFSPQIRI